MLKQEPIILTQEELQKMLACAWDDGYGCGFDDCENNPTVAEQHLNPFE